MRPISFMLIAGEASGDQLAAELVRSLRLELNRAGLRPTNDYQPLHATLEPRFFGAGGPQMAAAGVDLAFDLTAHAVVGFSDVVRHYFKFRRFFYQLRQLAIERQPDAVICVDFAGFNRRLADSLRRYASSRQDWFHAWNPKFIQYVSPQVWASREGRAYQMAQVFDLLLSIFPFEPAWYARRVPAFPVKFVGHPLIERYGPVPANPRLPADVPRTLLLLPGSRRTELEHHLPVMIDALQRINRSFPNLNVQLICPNDKLKGELARFSLPSNIETRVGGLPEALSTADVAIASTGTVTLECARFAVPIVALYKTTRLNYAIGKRLARVKYLAMPNLLADEEIMPEFIQDAATGESIAHATLDLLQNLDKRRRMQARFLQVVALLGLPGANRSAARAIVDLMEART